MFLKYLHKSVINCKFLCLNGKLILYWCYLMHFSSINNTIKRYFHDSFDLSFVYKQFAKKKIQNFKSRWNCFSSLKILKSSYFFQFCLIEFQNMLKLKVFLLSIEKNTSEHVQIIVKEVTTKFPKILREWRLIKVIFRSNC